VAFGIKHFYLPGAVYLKERLKYTPPQKCFFAFANEPTRCSIAKLGYSYGKVIPMICEHNLNEVAYSIVEAAQGKLVIVGIGSPNQDLLAQKIVELDPKLEVLCVGAAVEFLAGTQKSPPAIVRRMSLEWLWRLVTNFSVTLPRLTVSVVSFLKLLIFKKLRS